MMVYSYDSVLNSFMLSMQVIEYDKGYLFDFSLGNTNGCSVKFFFFLHNVPLFIFLTCLFSPLHHSSADMAASLHAVSGNRSS